MSDNNNTGHTSNVVAKAGLWYTICNFLFRGLAFITTPIFTRLMTKAELGSFSNFSSWAIILSVVTSFDLAQSIIRSKLEHEDDMDSYVWSILSFSTIWTLLVYGIVLLSPETFAGIMKIDVKYIHIMFLYLLAAPPYQMLITKHRAFYKYKMFVLLTGIMAVSGTLMSLGMVLLMQDKLAGRIIGFYTPHIIIGFIIFLVIAVRGKKIKTKYWKYACVICIPLVPHVLSLNLLSTSDTLIITRLCGAEYTAIYSIAYSAYHIITILFDSMNKAWAPWLLESLHHEKYPEIKRVSKIYISIFEVIIIGILILIPEIILILGGKQYAGAIYCLPPLATSCVFQLVYTMYVNIELYKKRTIGVSIATMIATAVNIILNLIFIPMNPEYSYVIAAYTTLAGYIVLFICHYYIVKKMGMAHVFEIKFILGIFAFTLLVSGIMNLVYRIGLVRYGIFAVYAIAVIAIGLKYKDRILGIFFKKKRA